MNATLHTSSNGRQITGTVVVNGQTVESFQVKDGFGLVRRVDDKLRQLGWVRGPFASDMTAQLAPTSIGA
jgi:hypothetical protein